MTNTTNAAAKLPRYSRIVFADKFHGTTRPGMVVGAEMPNGEIKVWLDDSISEQWVRAADIRVA